MDNVNESKSPQDPADREQARWLPKDNPTGAGLVPKNPPSSAPFPARSWALASEPRWVVWRSIERGGKATKVPFQANGKTASSTDTSTWATLPSLEGLSGFSGVGIILKGDGLGGVDLDHCRDPQTGEIDPWALEIIQDFQSYAEISPSGKGVKILAWGAPDTLPSNRYNPPGVGPKGEDSPHADIYVTGRYFTVTGERLDGLPDEPREAREAWGRLSLRLGPTTPPKRELSFSEPRIPFSVLQKQMEAIPSVWKVWLEGGKTPSDRSSNDAALATVMGAADFSPNAIRSALTLSPLGQISSRKFEGAELERQVVRLLDMAEKHREEGLLGEDAPTEQRAWEAEPEPILGGAPEPLPVEMMPEALRDHVLSITDSIQVPQDLPAVMALGAISAAVAGKVVVEVKPHGEWVEPVQLWTGAIAASGARKSPTFKHLFEPLKEWEATEKKRRKGDIDHAKNLVSVAEEVLKKAKKEKVEGHGSFDAIRRAQDALNDAKENIPRNGGIIIGNATPESLSKELEQIGGRGAILEPEPGIFNSLLAGLYTGGSPQLDEINKAYSGERILVQRISRAEVDIPNPSLTVAVCIQPGVLEGLANKGALRGQGTLARFLWVQPKDTVGHRLVGSKAPSMDHGARERYGKMIVALLEAQALDEKPSGEMTPHVMRLTPEARGILDRFDEWLEPTLRVGAENEQIRDWASKAPGRAIRIAALLEAAQRASDGGRVNLGGSLSAWAMEAGVAFVKKGLSHARVVMGTASPEAHALDDLLSVAVALAKEAEDGVITTRELHQKVKDGRGGKYKKKAGMAPLLKELEERGLVQMWLGESGAKGGRRSEFLAVHPSLLPTGRSQPGPEKEEWRELDEVSFLNKIREGAA